MKRRSFIRSGITGGAGAMAASAWGMRTEPGLVHAAAVQPFELDEITIAGLQKGMESGRWSAKQVTQLYLARIEQAYKQGPARARPRGITPSSSTPTACAARASAWRGSTSAFTATWAGSWKKRLPP